MPLSDLAVFDAMTPDRPLLRLDCFARVFWSCASCHTSCPMFHAPMLFWVLRHPCCLVFPGRCFAPVAPEFLDSVYVYLISSCPFDLVCLSGECPVRRCAREYVPGR